MTNTLVKVGDKSVEIESTLASMIRATGTIVPLKDYAAAKGVSKPSSLRGNSEQVQQWKTLVKTYNQNKVIFSRRVKQLAALVATDDTLKGTKAQVKLNADGTIASGAFTFRSLNKTDVKAIQSNEQTELARQNKELAAQLEAAKELMRAAGIEIPA
jgi:hypothetical protein